MNEPDYIVGDVLAGSDWHGCYDDGWGDLIVPDAFAHPAKFARGLIERIIRHGLARGYWHAGECIADPFGGVGLGGIIAAYHGLAWRGVELEPRFVELGRRNFALHAAKLAALNAPQPTLLQGDSRQFAEIIGAAVGIVTSPPYADSVDSEHCGIKWEKVKPDYPGRVMHQQRCESRQKAHEGYNYGTTPGQIGKLPAGDLAAVVTSPPYGAGDSGSAASIAGRSDKSANWIKANCGAACHEGYGPSPANIGNLPAGIVTSPPYVSVDAGKKMSETQVEGFLEGQRETHPGRNDEALKKMMSRWTCTPDSPGQIGALPAGTLDGAITSPPYAGSAPEKSGSGIDVEKQWQTYRQQGGGMSLEKFRQQQARHSAGYGSSDGQIGALPEGRADAVVTSPPFEDREPCQDKAFVAHHDSRATLTAAYGSTHGQIGQDTGETYWTAMRQVYSECRKALKPGGILCVVLKDYVSKGKRVRLCDQTLALLVDLGFEPIERVRAWLVKEERTASLFGGEIVKTTARKSFFRRLYEARLPADSDLRIDCEEVLFMRAGLADRPLSGRLP